MFDFRDQTQFRLLHSFEMQTIYTWGDRDPDKRELIREAAKEGFKKPTFNYSWCGFSILIERSKGGRDLDLENVPKLIVDAFSGWQINRDRSKYRELKLYPEDTLRYVRAIYLNGKFVDDEDRTIVRIYGNIKE